MKMVTLILGVLMIIGGIAYMSFGGFTYTTEEKVVDIGPFEATAETEKQVPYSPLLAGAVIVGGVVLAVVGAKKSQT